jgi:hypothetical protein
MSTVTNQFKSNGSSLGSDHGSREPIESNFVEVKPEPKMDRAPPR